MAEGGRRHSRLPPDVDIAAYAVRAKNTPILAEDSEQSVWRYIALGVGRIHEAMGELARQIENRGRIVDEYNTVPITGASSQSTVSVFPTYDFMPEKIMSIVVTGPPGATATLTLGDRQWPIVMPAAGILPIGPLGIVLGRSDVRQLVSSTAGLWTLELMGYADSRFQT